MQTVPVLYTVRVGNHLLSPGEVASGQLQRLPFVGEDGAPTDPDTVALWLLAPTGAPRVFRWPDPAPADTGAVTRQEAGRFYVEWTADEGEDGVWQVFLAGAMALGASQSDQGVFYVRRPSAPGPVEP